MTMESKIENLIDFAVGMYNQEDGKKLYQTFLADIQTVTPQDVFMVEYDQLKMGRTPKELLTVVDKLINVFYKSLSNYQWERPKKGTFLYIMMEENKAMLKHLDWFRDIIKEQSYDANKEKMLQALKELQAYNQHLLKLENILFPYMEKNMDHFEGLKIMWSLHDEVRQDLKGIIYKIDNKQIDGQSLNVDMGLLFFMLHGLVQKQELILFPSASEVLDIQDFEAMHLQSFEYEFCFIDKPENPKRHFSDLLGQSGINAGELKMATGTLTLSQIETLINTLPVDITLVDANDQVAFFSRPKDRIFPRSVAVIGRNVRNCHPPESVHVVEEILKNFKEGKRDDESFWIQMKGMFILIQYFALRNDSGEYLGTLEVSQEISHIRQLEGEKRLLDR